MILLAASLALLAVIARAIDRFAQADHDTWAIKATRGMLWAYATVVVVQGILGAFGLLTPLATLVALAVLAAGTSLLARGRPPVTPYPPQDVSVLTVNLLVMLIALFAFRLWSGLHRPAFLYDTLSYHLHVPATWMHDRRITIVPAVFGDPSPAYAPGNLELWLLFLMAPLRSDYLARIGQLPFGVLAATAIFAALRDGAAHRLVGIGGALAFLLIPEVFGQIPTAMNDLAFAACLLATLPFIVRLWAAERPRRIELIAVATAIGLAVGTKYAAAPLALPFAALAAAAWFRRRPFDLVGPAAALALLIATGGFWYVRNAIVTGNPIYPVAVVGLHLPSLYGRAEMRAWDYHVPVGDLRALGSLLLGAGVGFCCAFLVVFARLWRRDVIRGVGINDQDPRYAPLWRRIHVSLFVALLTIFWFVIPYQESRFLFPLFGVAAVIVARAAHASVWAAFGLGAAIVGALIQSPTMDRALLVAVGATAVFVFRRRDRLAPHLEARTLRVAGAAGAVALAAALAFGANSYARRDPGYSVGDDLAEAWSWMRANVHDTRVAYTGTNLAFPLAGERLANRVAYVNVAGASGHRLHDFGPPGDGTAEPAPYRRGASAEVWLANLRAAGTQVLFVAALYPIVERTVEADDDGFPAERAWADARPGVFRLRHASAAARIYDVVSP